MGIFSLLVLAGAAVGGYFFLKRVRAGAYGSDRTVGGALRKIFSGAQQK